MADNITTICGSILDSVFADASINTYVSTNFGGASLALYLGLDVQALPDEAGLPYFAAVPQSFGIADEENHKANRILVTLSLKKEGQSAPGNYNRFDGLVLLDELTNLIEANLTLNFDYIEKTEVSIDLDYPYFRASWAIVVPTEI